MIISKGGNVLLAKLLEVVWLITRTMVLKRGGPLQDDGESMAQVSQDRSMPSKVISRGRKLCPCTMSMQAISGRHTCVDRIP
jgi:hypothetical protein